MPPRDVLSAIAVAVVWGLTFIAIKIGAKIAGRVDMLAFVAWSSLAAPAPLFLAALWLDGPVALAGLARPSLRLVVSVLVLSFAGTTFGFCLWSRLLARHPAAAVAPFALLAPIVGMVAGGVVFGEPLDAFELWGAVLVMAGLGVNVFSDRLLRRRWRPVG